MAPSSSAERLTKHSTESFDTVESLSSAKIPSDVINSLHFNRSSWPSLDPVKPFQIEVIYRIIFLIIKNLYSFLQHTQHICNCNRLQMLWCFYRQKLLNFFQAIHFNLFFKYFCESSKIHTNYAYMCFLFWWHSC